MRNFLSALFLIFFSLSCVQSSELIREMEEESKPKAFFCRVVKSFNGALDTVSSSSLGKIPEYAQRVSQKLNYNAWTKIATGVGILWGAQEYLYPLPDEESTLYTMAIGSGVEYIGGGMLDLLKPALTFTYKAVKEEFFSRTPKEDKYKGKHKKERTFSMEESQREDVFHFLKVPSAYFLYSLNMAASIHTFLGCLKQLTRFYEKGLNPFSLSFPEGMAQCVRGSYFCMPLVNPCMMGICIGDFLYNLNEMLTLWKRGVLYDGDMTLFGVFNGLTLGSIVKDVLLPWEIEQAKNSGDCVVVAVLDTAERVCSGKFGKIPKICAGVKSPSDKLMNFKKIDCKISFLSRWLIRSCGGASYWMVGKNVGKILKNGWDYGIDFLQSYQERYLLEKFQKAEIYNVESGDGSLSLTTLELEEEKKKIELMPPVREVEILKEEVLAQKNTLEEPLQKSLPKKVKTKTKKRKTTSPTKMRIGKKFSPAQARIEKKFVPNKEALALLNDTLDLFETPSFPARDLQPLMKRISDLKGLEITTGANVSLGRYTFELPHGGYKGKFEPSPRKRRAEKALLFALFDGYSREQINNYLNYLEEKDYSLSGFIVTALFKRE